MHSIGNHGTQYKSIIKNPYRICYLRERFERGSKEAEAYSRLDAVRKRGNFMIEISTHLTYGMDHPEQG